MIDALVSGLEIVNTSREGDIQRFVSCDVMRRSSAVEEKKGFFSAAVIIVHLQTEVRRVYGDLHAERGYVTRKSCAREGVVVGPLSL